MNWLLPVLLLLGFGLNGVRLRRRLLALHTLEPTSRPVAPRHRFVTAQGVELDEATRRAASAFADRERLEVVDLIPRDLPAGRALDLARMVATRTFRTDRLAPARGAFQALLVDAGVLERAGVVRLQGLNPVEFADLTARLKRYAPASTDLAVAPDLHATPDEPDQRLALLRAVHSVGLPIVLGSHAVTYAALVASVLASPAWGVAAAIAFCAQPYIAFAGRVPLAPGDLHRTAVFRLLSDPLRWLRTLAGRWRRPAESDPYDQRRRRYAEDLAAGTQRFFEPRRETCPWCGSARLSARLTTTDLVQRKPGRFTLEQCGDCRHIFQNPRLSLAGLDFYYRDFYDGLGEGTSEFVFSANGRGYRERAEMLIPFAAPKTWLDVGTGHGHFCNIARDTWPDTVFDGLDMSEAIEEAERRRWVAHGYRGLFCDLAGELAGRYTVVSMHHYLEHTREPLDELDAAAKVLVSGGFLLIEVPNPESRFGRVLGRFWLPWFQPQHQHLIPLDNLLRALDDRGFSPVAVQRGPAHIPVDLTGAVGLALNTCAPDPWLPWIEGEPTRWRRSKRAVLIAAGLPLLLGFSLLDHLLLPLLRRTQGGNAYRVLARKHA